MIVFDKEKWLNEKHVEEQLRHSHLSYITRQYPLELRKQRQELQNCGGYQPCRKHLREDFAIQVILDCRTPFGVDSKSRLGFNQYDPIMTQEQSILSKIKTTFSAEKIIFQYCFLGYCIDAYFPKHKLAIELDEEGHHNRDIGQEIERKKTLEKELVVFLSELIQLKKILMFLLKLVKYKITLLDQQRKE